MSIVTKQKDEEGDDNDQDVVTGEIDEDMEDEQEETEKEKRKGMFVHLFSSQKSIVFSVLFRCHLFGPKIFGKSDLVRDVRDR